MNTYNIGTGDLRWDVAANPSALTAETRRDYSTALSAEAITGALQLEKMYKSYVSIDSNGATACFWLYEK
jgi:hypothetical protein